MTIKDIAEKAGVSIATVSYVLNGKKKVSEQTRIKIQKIIQESGYEFNGAARDLKNKQNNIVGICLESLRGPFFSELIDGIETAATDVEYNFIITTNIGGERSSAVKILSERRVDGAIILSPNLSNEFIHSLVLKNIPLVLLDRKFEHDRVNTILLNNRSGIQQAIEHLHQKALTKIAFLSGVETHFDNKERVAAYIETMEKIHLKHEIQIYKGNFRQESGRNLATQIISKEIPMPEAIICANDEMAIGVIHALKEHGFNIPQDISIIGFDDILVSRYIQPLLSTISHPKFELGKLAFETLLSLLKGEKIENVTFDTLFIPRESSL